MDNSIVAFAVLAAISLTALHYATRRSSKWSTKLKLVTGSILALAWLSPLYYEFPLHSLSGKPITKVLTIQYGKPMVRRFGAFCLEFTKRCINAPAGEATTLVGSVTSLTANPKVREVKYHLTAEVVSFEQFYRTPERQNVTASGTETGTYGTDADLSKPKDGTQLVAATVFRLVYEFNREHSTALAEFDNPLDAGQNARLKQLLENYLNPRLTNDGVRVTFSRFTIN